MGKAVDEGRSEVDKCAWVCEHYAEHGAAYLQDEDIETEASRSYVTFEPLGVVLAVMPWNFPFWQVFRFAAPGLFAGNAGLLKPASNVFGCALAIRDVFREAGFPEDIFQTLLIGSPRVASVIENPGVAAVTLTGSTPAGREVAATAGAALKKTVLELGGSDPYVILEDADLEKAAAQCVTSRLINAGQSCIAAKRFIVPRRILKRFQDLVVSGMKEAVLGDPLSRRTTVGPMARHDLRDELHQQVAESVAKGARCLLGGEVPPGPGAFYPATVLTDVGPGMPAYEDELFGPVAAIIPVSGDEEAVLTANDTVFGLGAAVFTTDLARGELIAARRLQAGSCFVNAFVRSDPRLPFGGIRESGYGRELSSFGIREFVNIKTVYID
jgi:succinate-semialdehyde dehydrogenase/glutarate-semialdehyde dehydrogenase